MALSIKDTETDRLVRELVAETGESITTAVATAVRTHWPDTPVNRCCSRARTSA